jgi:hypothetical protein
MASKKRKFRQKMDFDPYDDFDDLYDEDLDLKDIEKDIYSTDWEDDMSESGKVSARRQIDRRREMKRLYSELDEWEEFVEKSGW